MSDEPSSFREPFDTIWPEQAPAAMTPEEKQRIREGHDMTARHNVGLIGMPQGPCQCEICREPAATGTPRTDANLIRSNGMIMDLHGYGEIVRAKDARSIETDLAAANAQLEQVTKERDEARAELESFKKTCGGLTAEQRFEDLMRVRNVLLKSGHNFGLADTEFYAIAVVEEVLTLRARIAELEKEPAWVQKCRVQEELTIATTAIEAIIADRDRYRALAEAIADSLQDLYELVSTHPCGIPDNLYGRVTNAAEVLARAQEPT